MDNLKEYLNKLRLKSEDHINKEYHLDEFYSSDFEKINFYLLNQAVDKNYNFFSQINDHKQKEEIYLPSFLAIAISLFFKNYCDNDVYEYKPGDILQKDRIRHEYLKKDNNGYHHLYRGSGGKVLTTTKDLRKNYVKINAKFSNKKIKTGFEHYKSFFNQIFPDINDLPPSQFKYKAAIILEKKPFLGELKKRIFTDIDLGKAIPFQWVKKSGVFEQSKVPIDPMIYLGPDYETIKENIIDNDVKIESVVIIGKNKYKEDDLRKLKQDLRYEKVPFSIIIGTDQIKDDNEQFSQWRWTPEEISILNETEQAVISSIEVPETNFVDQIVEIETFIKELKREYSFELPSFAKIKRFLYALVLPDKEGRIANQIEYTSYLINKEFTENIKLQLENQNIEPDNTIAQFKEKIDNLFQSFDNIKLSVIGDVEFDFLIVPNLFEGIWKNESNFRILSFKEFKQKTKQEEFSTSTNFLFISPFGYRIYSEELLILLSNTKHNYQFLCYPEEAKVVDSLQNRHRQNVSKELSSKSREKLSGIKFYIPPIEPEPESINDLIGRINSKNSHNNDSYSYEASEIVNYCIDFEDGTSIILEGNKQVLLEIHNNKVKMGVSSLKDGDQIRVYSNEKKEVLYKLAIKQDDNNIFTSIENKSLLWKQCLRKYYNKQNIPSEDSLFYLEGNLFKDLKKCGLSVTEHTLKNWLNHENSVKFPQQDSDLYAIKRCINDPEFNNKFNEIIASKNTYNGIMIALGQNLSDEVIDYILDKKKGKILSTFSEDEIKAIINSSAPLRTISAINITEQDETE